MAGFSFPKFPMSIHSIDEPCTTQLCHEELDGAMAHLYSIGGTLWIGGETIPDFRTAMRRILRLSPGIHQGIAVQVGDKLGGLVQVDHTFNRSLWAFLDRNGSTNGNGTPH